MKRLVIVVFVAALVVVLVLHWQSQRSTEITILVHMIDNQGRWFRERLKGFEEENDVDLKFVSFDRMAEVKALLESERDASVKTIGLVKIQKPMLATLVQEELVMPLDEIVSGRQLVLDMKTWPSFPSIGPTASMVARRVREPLIGEEDTVER